MKDNAVYHVVKVIIDKTKKKNARGVLKEQYITVAEKIGNKPNAIKSQVYLC